MNYNYIETMSNDAYDYILERFDSYREMVKKYGNLQILHKEIATYLKKRVYCDIPEEKAKQFVEGNFEILSVAIRYYGWIFGNHEIVYSFYQEHGAVYCDKLIRNNFIDECIDQAILCFRLVYK